MPGYTRGIGSIAFPYCVDACQPYAWGVGHMMTGRAD